MKLDELQNEWKADATIDKRDLGGESIRIPNLHAKYLTYLSKTRLSLRKAESECIQMVKLKERYFNGELSREELEERGWTPYQFNKPLKSQMDGLVQAEPEVVRLVDRIEYWKTVIEFLEYVMKSLHSRSYDVKNAIEWEKIKNGII